MIGVAKDRGWAKLVRKFRPYSGFRSMANNRMQRHKEMYKWRPQWKDSFRQQCFERLRSSRCRLVDKFRGQGRIMDDEQITLMVQEEWKKLCGEEPDLLKGIMDLKDIEDSEVDDILALIDEIKEELLEEGKRISAENYIAEEASVLESAISLLQEQVICPMCQKSPLSQYGSIIQCSCGLFIDTQQDGLTLAHLKLQLEEGLKCHEENCRCSPSFCLINVIDITNLAITCDVCSFMYIVV